MSEPGAVATGSKIQLCRDHAPVFLSPAKAGFENQRGFDPRATLAALAHPGLLSVAVPGRVGGNPTGLATKALYNDAFRDVNHHIGTPGFLPVKAVSNQLRFVSVLG